MNFRKYWWIGLFVIKASVGQTIVNDFNPRLRGAWGLAGQIWGMMPVAETSDGGVLICGRFDYLNRALAGGIVKLDQNGNSYPGFQKVNTDGYVEKVKVLPSGKILILGDFTKINGIDAPTLSRLNTDGSLDQSFQSIPDAMNFAVASNGKIIVAKKGTGALDRFNADGTSDFASFPTYYSGVTNYFIEVDNNDLIYHGGPLRLQRLQANGQVDNSFSPLDFSSSASLNAVKCLNDGSILISGGFSSIQGFASKRLAKIKHNGSVDTGFKIGQKISGNIINNLSIRANGNILVTGQVESFDGVPGMAAELSPTGELLFVLVQPNGIDEGFWISELSNRKIIIFGNFLKINGQPRIGIGVLKQDYTLDQNFLPFIESVNGKGDSATPAPLVDSQNRPIFVSGWADATVLGMYEGTQTITKQIFRMDTEGHYDPTFVAPSFTNSLILGAAIQDDDKILIAGTYVNSPLTRLMPNGAVDNSFKPTLNQYAFIRKVKTKGNKVYISGQFGQVNGGITRYGIAVLNSDGTPTSFASPLGQNSDVMDIFVQSDDKILALVGFNNPTLIRLMPDGQMDASFTQGRFTADVNQIEVDATGNIYCVGRFFDFNSAARSHIVRLSPDGTLDNSFITGSEFGSNNDYSFVNSATLLPNGNLVVGGKFSSYRGSEANGLVVIGSTGSFIPTPTLSLNRSSSILTMTNRNGYIFGLGRAILDNGQKIFGLLKIESEPTLAASSLSAIVSPSGEVQLSWIDNSTNEEKFIIEQSIGNSANFTPIGEVNPNVTTYSKSLAANKTYYFRVTAYNRFHAPATSQIVSAIWLQPPAPPTDLTATLTEATLKLSWIDNSTDEDGFSIERSVGTPSNFVQLANVSANVTTYSEVIQPLITYYYRVHSFFQTENSVNTPVVSFTWDGIPSAPSQAGAILQGSKIKITWLDNSFDEDRFVIERKELPSGTFITIGTASAGTISFTDNTVDYNKRYAYRIFSKNTYGSSAASNEVEVNSLSTPIAPSELAGVIEREPSLLLRWKDNSNNEEGFVLERSVGDATNFSLLATLGPNVTSYSDNIDPLITYYYRIHSYAEILVSGNSAVFSFTWDGSPASPSPLSATLEGVGIRLAWQDNSLTELSYQIQQKKVGEPTFVTISTVSAGVITYLDNSISFHNTYVYRIVATNAVGASYSNEIQISALSNPTAPTDLVVTISGSGFLLRWADHATSEAGFIIERKLSTDGSFAGLSTSATPDVTSYQDNAIVFDKIYNYRVAAVNAAGKSTYSNVAVSPLILGIEDSEPVVNIYPNPATDKITIDLKNVSGVHLIDSKGANIETHIHHIDKNQVELTTSDLNAGLYILILKCDGGTIVRKIVKM